MNTMNTIIIFDIDNGKPVIVIASEEYSKSDIQAICDKVKAENPDTYDFDILEQSLVEKGLEYQFVNGHDVAWF